MNTSLTFNCSFFGHRQVENKIKTISATCISNPRGNAEEEIEPHIKECLCQQLVKEMFQYITLEKYVMADEPWLGENKYIATIKIIEE